MTRETGQLGAELHHYLVEHGARPDEVQRDLIAETERLLPERAQMQISPEQGALLTMLAKIGRARFAVEVGTFTGYSALAIARGLTPDGHLLCCDISTEFTEVARRYWERDRIRERIELRLGPASETLRALPEEPEIDLSFIDADKTGYIDYWEQLVPRTRPGGLLTVDNVLAGGRVLDDDETDINAQAIRAFNEHVLRDDRVELTMLPISDGITIARRR
ncbi:caffeoyl-CoA O-methyltransferase [Halopolyspora algeriensis]|uniref:Caffeoyl-CoA O-methyltransferase n=1 Tax=Halopolyspora algeriensis TaxID=1500506 RepID=A0A368VXY4_9ACTN|nr:class I SAM-dependent methyltransferase [Halopolyspora algeriensis]RCW46177.1 caffeoyl-CoA O-methyltransferase [Halopolyspora algeriensis]TQM55580.1 caffeoyl-CoA O-methyltransferase [Halopolyspora algeriensis]